MLVKTNRQLSILTIGVTLVSLAGCSGGSDYPDGYKSRFVYSDRTDSLMGEAQNGIGDLPGVKKLVDDRFGDPQKLNAWLKLPIDFGGVTGELAETPDASVAVEELTLSFDGEVTKDGDKPLLLQFVTGKAAPSIVFVSNWLAEGGKASLTAAMDVPPAAGDQVVVNGGGVLAHGRGLYMRHCSHCHGTSGDGKGPTAEYLVPRPRDYRHGVFKFTSTDAQSKVSRDDLYRILRNGVPGTYMPSFVPMLQEDELVAVIEYVRFLAMRGEFERKLVNELASDYSEAALQSRKESGESRKDIVEELKEFLTDDMQDSLAFVSDDLAESWDTANSEDALIVPDCSRIEDSIASRRIGRELYLSKTLNCADCHGISAKGNGPQTTIYEKNPITSELYPDPGLHDVWDNVNQPRNLTQGIYRGGRRPVDLFRRIHAGIKGSRMPSFKKVLKHEEIWHIVNYVLSVPFNAEPGHAPVAVPDEPAATAAL